LRYGLNLCYKHAAKTVSLDFPFQQSDVYSKDDLTLDWRQSTILKYK